MVLEENGISLILNRKEIKLKASSANKDLYKTEGISFNSIWRGLVGLATLIFIAFLFSSNRKAISWPLVGKGLLIQLIFAILVLKVPFVTSGFEIVSGFFIKIISFTQEGTDFLFGSFVTGKIEMALINFVIQVLPTIVFFAALTSLLYYWGVLQKIVYVFAWLMRKVMKLSGAESLAAAGNIFLGQTESPLLIRPYLDKMTKSELMCLMSGGMATIAGGVLAAYIGFLGGSDPVQQMFYAKHLLAASVMSAPAAIVAAKILVPETESFNEKMEISNERFGSNALEAIANGTTEGIKLAVNVAGMLLVFIAFIAMANYIFQDLIGAGLGINEKIAEATNGRYDGLSLQFIFGLVFAPLSWLMGVAKEDIVLVGQLLGEKTILNEFVAYVSLGEMKEAGVFVSEKSIIMATYILCGFANFASIGIQIGGIGSLIPGRKGLLASLGIRALIGGTLASLFTAVLVGMIY
ncbi:MAG TPA: Na+ dependent nucleoside transporter [Flavobacteriales bacterium]|nr:Na+ dependent nucleoside transporter [Flavobacteriales bacterium]